MIEKSLGVGLPGLLGSEVLETYLGELWPLVALFVVWLGSGVVVLGYAMSCHC